METLDSLEMADDSSGNSGMVKSEDGSPSHGNGRSSPPPNCAICLGRCKNKSFTDSCLHQFCFKCLLTWSRVKTECPLCKQNFKSIIHNVKSNHQYEEYRVQQPQSEDRAPTVDFSDIFNAARRFRYRTTLTLPRRETMAIRQFLMHYPLSALMNEVPLRPAARERARPSPADFRRTVYRHNLWARPLPDFTGRFRDCSPDFFRYNDSQVHRLVPWLSRELFYLLNENSAHVTYVLGRILELLPQHPILSVEFRAELHRYLGERTDHFLHEFHCFASTPYDITGYDRHVQYQTDERLANASLVSEVLSSSDTDSHDSDIVMVSSSHATEPPSPVPPAPGTSRVDIPAPTYPQPAVIPIETISHSDSDTDSEVMVVGYIKPPHQRTPELVDLLASDSDVVVQEPDEPPPPPPPPPATASAAAAVPASGRSEQLVRIKLSMRRSGSRPRSPASSDGSPSYTPPRAPRRKRRTCRAASIDDNYSVASTPSSEDYESDAVIDSPSSSDGRRKRTAKRKPKKKSTRGSRSRVRADSRRAKETKKSGDGDKRTKGKSRNGKDVKSSKTEPYENPLPTEAVPAPENDSAGPSGIVDSSKRKRSTESASAPALGVAGLCVDGKKAKSSTEPAPASDGAVPSAQEGSSKRKRNAEPPLAFDGAGPSGQESSLKRKRSAEPASTFDRAGPSGQESGSKRKKSAEPMPAFDGAGPNGQEGGSKKKRNAEPMPAFDRGGSCGQEGGLKRKGSAEPMAAVDRVGSCGQEGGSKTKRSAEPTLAFFDSTEWCGQENRLRRKRKTEPMPGFDGAGPSGFTDDSKRKRSSGKEEPALVLDRAGPSSLEGRSETRSRIRSAQGSPPLHWPHSNKNTGHMRRVARENRRLKSIVKVMKRDSTSGAGSYDATTRYADSCVSDTSQPRFNVSPGLFTASRSSPNRDSTSSSDDNIPLHLALSKPYGLSRTYVSDFSD